MIIIKERKNDELFGLIIVECNENELNKNILINENLGWKSANQKDYYYRIDSENPRIHQQRHVHIAHKNQSNINTKQVSWNKDKTRHDRMYFDNNFKGMEIAKNIARKVLGLSSDSILENIQVTRSIIKLMENTSDLCVDNNAIYLKVRSEGKF